MSLAGVLRRGVATANRLTRSFQAVVTHKAYATQDGFGEKTFSPTSGTPRYCLIQQQVQDKKLPDGRLVAVQAVLTFLEEIEPAGIAGRVEPIDVRDEFILPDGSTGPVVFVGGPYNPEEEKAFVLQVWLGTKRTEGASGGGGL